jgi:hypothetical protein
MIMRVRYNDFEDYELDDARAMRRMMHERQVEGLRLSKKHRRVMKGPRNNGWDDWDDLDDYDDVDDFDDYDDYDEDEFDSHS